MGDVAPTQNGHAQPQVAESLPKNVRNESDDIPSYYCPVPANEEERMETVRCIYTGDEAEDPVLKAICGTCVSVLRGGHGAVTIAKGDVLHYIATYGCPTFDQPRSMGFCGWSFMSQDPQALVVEDTHLDDRFRMSPMAHPGMPFPPLRFYAGCPLVASTGQRLGTLCVVDSKPHKVKAGDITILTNLAEMAVRQLEKDALLKLQQQANKRLLRSLNSVREPLMVVDLEDPAWPILVANGAWEQKIGRSLAPSEDKRLSFWDVFEPEEAKGAVLKRADKSLDCGGAFRVVVRAGEHALALQLRPTSQQNEAPNDNLIVGIPSFLETGSTAPNSVYMVTPMPTEEPSLEDSVGLESRSSSLGSLDSLASWSSLSGVTSMMDRLADGKGVEVSGSMEVDFKEVKLQQLISSNRRSKLFRGTWNDANVVVKVLRTRPGEHGAGNVPPEAAVSVEMSHPNLVRGFKYAVCRHGPKPERPAYNETWIVQEWCGRGTLADAITRGWLNQPGTRRLNVDFAALTAAEIASGLHALHKAGVVHANLNSENVFLAHAENSRGFTAKLAGGGISHPDNKADEDHPLRVLGTHVPPEVLQQGVVTSATDVWGLGVLLWEMGKQQRAWSSMSWRSVYDALMQPRSLLALFQQLPPNIQMVVDACTEADPERRPQAKALQKTLANLDALTASGDTLELPSSTPLHSEPSAASPLASSAMPATPEEAQDAAKTGPGGSAVAVHTAPLAASESKLDKAEKQRRWSFLTGCMRPQVAQ